MAPQWGAFWRGIAQQSCWKLAVERLFFEMPILVARQLPVGAGALLGTQNCDCGVEIAGGVLFDDVVTLAGIHSSKCTEGQISDILPQLCILISFFALTQSHVPLY